MFYIIEKEIDPNVGHKRYLSIRCSDLCISELTDATWFPSRELAEAVVYGFKLGDFEVVVRNDDHEDWKCD